MFSECKKYTTEQTGIVFMNFDFLFQFFGTLTSDIAFYYLLNKLNPKDTLSFKELAVLLRKQ